MTALINSALEGVTLTGANQSSAQAATVNNDGTQYEATVAIDDDHSFSVGYNPTTQVTTVDGEEGNTGDVTTTLGYEDLTAANLEDGEINSSDGLDAIAVSTEAGVSTVTVNGTTFTVTGGALSGADGNQVTIGSDTYTYVINGDTVTFTGGGSNSSGSETDTVTTDTTTYQLTDGTAVDAGSYSATVGGHTLTFTTETTITGEGYTATIDTATSTVTLITEAGTTDTAAFQSTGTLYSLDFGSLGIEISTDSTTTKTVAGATDSQTATYISADANNTNTEATASLTINGITSEVSIGTSSLTIGDDTYKLAWSGSDVTVTSETNVAAQTLTAAGYSIDAVTESGTVIPASSVIQVGQYLLALQENGSFANYAIASDSQTTVSASISGTSVTIGENTYTITPNSDGTYSITSQAGSVIQEAADSDNAFGGPLGQYIDSTTGMTTFQYADTDGNVNTVTLNYAVTGSEVSVVGTLSGQGETSSTELSFTAGDGGVYASDEVNGITIQLTSGALSDNKLESKEIKLMGTLNIGMSDTNTAASGTADGPARCSRRCPVLRTCRCRAPRTRPSGASRRGPSRSAARPSAGTAPRRRRPGT